MTSAGLIRSARRRNTSSRSVVRSAPDSSSASISSSSEPPAALMTRRSACLELPELPEPEPPSSAAASCSLIAGIITERAGLWRPDIGPSSDFDDDRDDHGPAPVVVVHPPAEGAAHELAELVHVADPVRRRAGERFLKQRPHLAEARVVDARAAGVNLGPGD